MARKPSAVKRTVAKKPLQNKASRLPEQLAPGAKAPAFSLPRDGGGMVSLADFAGSKLVLYFYPRADTTGCTKEAMDFSRLEGAFARAGAQIVGVSADPVPAQDKFKAKYKLAIALASDETHRMLEAYGVWQQKIAVRAEVHGHRAHDVSDRPGCTHRQCVAEGFGRRPRRGRAGRRQIALSSTSL